MLNASGDTLIPDESIHDDKLKHGFTFSRCILGIFRMTNCARWWTHLDQAIPLSASPQTDSSNTLRITDGVRSVVCWCYQPSGYIRR